jgi:hypothetical protein
LPPFAGTVRPQTRQPLSGIGNRRHDSGPASLKPATLRTVEQFAAPATVMAFATLCVLLVRADPPATLRALPAIVLPISVLLSLWFNRGRAFLASVSLFLSYLG